MFLLKNSSTPLARFGPRQPRSAALAQTLPEVWRSSLKETLGCERWIENCDKGCEKVVPTCLIFDALWPSGGGGKVFKQSVIFQSEMAPRYEICVGLDKGHKTTPNTLVAKPSKKKVGRVYYHCTNV